MIIKCPPHESRTAMSKNELKTVSTWNRRSRFCYKGSVKKGTLISYRSGFAKEISASIYQEMLACFRGKTVYCKAPRDNPKADSLGKWLEEEVSNPTITSYVSAILVNEGYAKKRCNEIEFLQLRRNDEPDE